jgi:tetratricopeptide (TPR) repeat protein
MRTWALALALLIIAGSAAGQRHELTIDTGTPEGQMLQQIGQEADEAKKLALMEQFATQYPKHEAMAWVYSQMVPAYTKANQHAKAIGAGEKLLALDPEDLRTAHAALKAAEAQKDPDAVKKWAIQTSEMARKMAQSPKPEDEDEAEDWQYDVDFAKQLETYTTDPQKKIELIETLEQRNAKSEYLPQVQGQYFLALQQIGDADRAVAVAEKILEKDQTNEDMLLVVADYNFQRNKELEKVLSYSVKLVELMGSKPKPEAVSEADWEKKKTVILGLAHRMTGVTYSNQKKFKQADQTLRQALPLIKGDDQLTAQVLFHLGLANYRLKKIVDAVKFNRQCVKIKSPFQIQARRNLRAIQSQYRVR